MQDLRHGDKFNEDSIMKKITAFIAVCIGLTACYEDFIFDYDYSAIYTMYQYDLRTFIPEEEDLQLSFSVALGGVIENERDRKVHVVLDNDLLVSDLSKFDPTGETQFFTALDGLKGNGKIGDISQSYVSNEFNAAGIASLVALPSSYYKLSSDGNLVIEKGNHTAKLRLTPTDEMFKDEKLLKPYYALAFRIDEADADKVLPEKSFQIMAVKVENTYYGNWYHGGKKVVVKDTDMSILSDQVYPFTLPQDDMKVYTLKTEGIHSVRTNKFSNATGELVLKFQENGNVIVEDPTGTRNIRPVNGQPSRVNGAKLLQDRKIFLNYAWSNGDGTSTYVTDTLYFRNRMRDGMSEWQDENPDHYTK